MQFQRFLLEFGKLFIYTFSSRSIPSPNGESHHWKGLDEKSSQTHKQLKSNIFNLIAEIIELI